MKNRYIILPLILIAFALGSYSCQDSLGIDSKVIKNQIGFDTIVHRDTIYKGRDTLYITDTTKIYKDSIVIVHDTIKIVKPEPKYTEGKHFLASFSEYFGDSSNPWPWPFIDIQASAKIDTSLQIPIIDLDLKFLRQNDQNLIRKRMDYVKEFDVKLVKFIPSLDVANLNGNLASGRWSSFTMGGDNIKDITFSGFYSQTTIQYSRLFMQDGRIKKIGISFLTKISNLPNQFETKTFAGTIYFDLY